VDIPREHALASPKGYERLMSIVRERVNGDPQTFAGVPLYVSQWHSDDFVTLVIIDRATDMPRSHQMPLPKGESNE